MPNEVKSPRKGGLAAFLNKGSGIPTEGNRGINHLLTEDQRAVRDELADVLKLPSNASASQVRDALNRMSSHLLPSLVSILLTEATKAKRDTARQLSLSKLLALVELGLDQESPVTAASEAGYVVNISRAAAENELQKRAAKK